MLVPRLGRSEKHAATLHRARCRLRDAPAPDESESKHVKDVDQAPPLLGRHVGGHLIGKSQGGPCRRQDEDEPLIPCEVACLRGKREEKIVEGANDGHLFPGGMVTSMVAYRPFYTILLFGRGTEDFVQRRRPYSMSEEGGRPETLGWPGLSRAGLAGSVLVAFR